MNPQDAKLLIIEDNQGYRGIAKKALTKVDPHFAIDYSTAFPIIPLYDLVISDVFFPQHEFGTSPELQTRALDAIKQGLVKTYVQAMCEQVKAETGVGPDDRLRKCFTTLGYSQLGCSDNSGEHMRRAVSAWVKGTGNDSANRLEGILQEMLVEKGAERNIAQLFNPLKKYMTENPANQPLGYLIGEEAEKLGKRFILVTSLAHSQENLRPILLSAKERGWNLLEAKDGSKDNPGFWQKAYDLVSEEKTK